MQLTEKQKTLIKGIMKGLTNKEIGHILNVKTSTVNTYIYLLCKMFEAKNRIDLSNKVKERGIL